MEPVIKVNAGRFNVRDVCFVVKMNVDGCQCGRNVGNVWLMVVPLNLLHVGFDTKSFHFFTPGASKWDIRQKVWDYIEEKNLANFPRPVHNRIPNFKAGFSNLSERAAPTRRCCIVVSQMNILTNEPWQ